jgi:hypothetical protein
MSKKWAIAFSLMTASALTTAEAAVFYVDPTVSAITLSGSGTLTGVSGNWTYTAFPGFSGGFTVTGAGALVQQGPGSLTTSLTGTIDASHAGAMLTFNNASISANNNGTWRPDGSDNAGNTAPAQLAGQVNPNVAVQFTDNILSFILNLLSPLLENQLGQTTYAAARSVDLDLTGSSAVAGDGSFDASSLTGAFTSGNINIGGLANETWALTGLSSSLGSVSGAFTHGIVDQLVLPFDWTFMEQYSLVGGGSAPDVNYNVTAGSLDITAHFFGQIVATTLPVPEPETYAMMLAGLGLLGFAARHRKLQAA